MRSLFVLALLCLIMSGIAQQYQTGSESSVVWTGSPPFHILQGGTTLPRSISVTVKFRTPFTTTPQVAISIYTLDWQTGMPEGFSATVSEITIAGFVVTYSAVSTRQLYTVFINYFAVVDSRIQIGYYETKSLGALTKGSGVREVSFDIKLATPFAAPPRAVVFLNGVTFTDGNYIISVGTGQIKADQIELISKTWGDTDVTMVRVCYIAGDASAFWVSDDTSYRVPDAKHPWVSRGPSYSGVPMSINVPAEWQSGDRATLWGFTAFDVGVSRNLRLSGRNIQLGTTQTTVELGTWWDTQLFQLNYRVMIYTKPPTAAELQAQIDAALLSLEARIAALESKSSNFNGNLGKLVPTMLGLAQNQVMQNLKTQGLFSGNSWRIAEEGTGSYEALVFRDVKANKDSRYAFWPKRYVDI